MWAGLGASFWRCRDYALRAPYWYFRNDISCLCKSMSHVYSIYAASWWPKHNVHNVLVLGWIPQLKAGCWLVLQTNHRFPQLIITITEKGPYYGPCYANLMLTPRKVDVKLGRWHNYHKGRVTLRIYDNQLARPLWPQHWRPNFTSTYLGLRLCDCENIAD